jgi:hypothetical protein
LPSAKQLNFDNLMRASPASFQLSVLSRQIHVVAIEVDIDSKLMAEFLFFINVLNP